MTEPPMHHDPEAIDDTPEDRRWRRLVDASLGGDPLAADDAAFLAAHRGDGPATRRERELLDALRRGEPDVTDPAADDALVAVAVDRFLAGNAAASGAPRPASGRRSALVIGMGVALAAAAAWLLLIRPFGHVSEDTSSPLAASDPQDSRAESIHDPKDSSGDSPAVKDSLAVRPPEPAPVPKDIPVELRLLRGGAGEEGPLALQQPLGDGPLRLAGAACVGAADRFTACAEGEAELRVRGAVLAVERGRVQVEVAPAGVGIVWVEVAGVAIVSDEPGALLIVAEPQRWRVTAVRGAHRLREGDRERSLAAGETADSVAQVVPADADRTERGAPSKPRLASDPGELIDEAHALRGAGKYRAAARIYRRLLREHGDTSLARTAQVALGQLSLGPLGDPRGALSAFDGYLRDAPQGALAEEALHGRVEALHRLGRDHDAAQAGAEFLRRFPRSRYAQDVRQRLDGG
ncbi:tetratricopeptide repeat protein [Nannocystis pusilla]|uniref:tetratricopeptide repeat protein n=1 Tax=Nannocystis pusilla TaxID=889268 RepID=UPI003BF066DC